MPKILQLKNAKIISNTKVKDGYCKIVLQAPAIARRAKPGQFVEIKVSDTPEPLLRRPFSIHRVAGAHLEVLYAVVGKGTEILSQRKKGAHLDVIGPLGNGFTVEKGQAIIVAGGIGVAPLVFLAEKLHKDCPTVLIGAKAKSQILCEKEFKDLHCSVTIATDDGSRGFRGRVTGALENLLKTHNSRLTTLYACGPKPMLKEVSRIARAHKMRAQISLEEHMACGIGACLGCVVKTTQGYKRVCKEGPVFEAKAILWHDNPSVT